MSGNKTAEKKPKVVFVLGGPGSGKGTQCAKIVENFGFVHLSAGDLLRAEINSGSENGTMIQNMIKEGKIVPAEVTVGLLQKAMNESKVQKFLIDGFPRNDENRVIFEDVTNIDPEFVLFFDCSEEEMERRLLGRNQGRVDDNIETIRKRFKVFVESSLPVVGYYEKKWKVRKVDAARPIDEVFDSIKLLFTKFVQDDLLQLSEELLHAVDSGDHITYKRLSDDGLTSFVPEAQGHLVHGSEFCKFYLDMVEKTKELEVSYPSVQSTISSPEVSILSDNVALVTYTRLQQKVETSSKGMVVAYNETRVWKRTKNVTGKWEWKNVHLHQSKAPIS